MKEDTGRPQAETDVLKFYVWLMLAMTVVLGGLYLKVASDLTDVERNVAQGEASIDEFAKAKRDISGMLDVYKNNKEDVARDQPNTWFSNIFTKCHIDPRLYPPGKWNGTFNPKGRFYEEQIDINIPSKQPLSRREIGEFCHSVEAASTRLRIVELELRRADKDDLEKDQWTGKVTVGYRYARKE